LIAYYGGVDLLEGPAHELTGLGLFVVAVALLVLFDGFLRLCARLIGSPAAAKSYSMQE
jgi:hypothetical protein